MADCMRTCEIEIDWFVNFCLARRHDYKSPSYIYLASVPSKFGYKNKEMVINFEHNKRNRSTLKFLSQLERNLSLFYSPLYTCYTKPLIEKAHVCQGIATILPGQYSISYVHPHELRLDSSMTRIKIRIFFRREKDLGQKVLRKIDNILNYNKKKGTETT